MLPRLPCYHSMRLYAKVHIVVGIAHAAWGNLNAATPPMSPLEAVVLDWISVLHAARGCHAS